MDKILTVKKLTKIYFKKDGYGIRNVNFQVKKGTFHAFIGENGAGKTTTIKSIINSYTNWSGEILIDGLDNKTAQSKAIIGYVPEKVIFPKDINVFDYLMGLGLLSGLNKKDLKEKIILMLKKMKIENLIYKKPYFFSTGQKKKIVLIQALIHNPKLIILDEPATNLDPTARFELFNILKTLKKDGKTIFISSHVLSEINPYTDSLTLIHKGEILYSGEKYKNLEKLYYEKIL